MQELQEQVLDIKEKFVAQWNEDIQVSWVVYSIESWIYYVLGLGQRK